MPHRTLLLPLRQAHRIIPAQNASLRRISFPFLCLEEPLLNLMLWHQEHLTRIAAEIIGLYRLPEGQGLFSLLGAKYHHVGEVTAFSRECDGVWARVFAEDAAGGEGGFYGADDQAGGGQEEVAGVVLRV
jgi:hypothetical protein